jgi:hypothetical protein
VVNTVHRPFLKHPEMKLKIGMALLALTALLVTASFLKKNGKTATRGALHTEIVATNGGYGYRIWAQDRLLVQQETIPAIAGNISFSSPKDAQLVAYFVKRKLIERENPRVQRADLEKMAINIPTLDRSITSEQVHGAFK